MTLTEVVAATALAGVLIGVHGGELNRQRVEMRLLNDESRVRDELLTAYERLRAGVLAPPKAIGERAAVEASNGALVSALQLSLERLPPSPALSSRVIAVRLRAEWRSFDGSRRHRELSTLIPARSAQ